VPRDDYKPGTRIRRTKGEPGVFMVYACSCRSYQVAPRRADGTFDFERLVNIPLVLAHRNYERVPDEPGIAPPAPLPKPSEALEQFLADIGSTDAFVKKEASPDTGEPSGLWRFADDLLGILRRELRKRADALKSRGA